MRQRCHAGAESLAKAFFFDSEPLSNPLHGLLVVGEYVFCLFFHNDNKIKNIS